MKAADILLHTRARLMDEKINDLRISNEFLLDILRIKQNKLIAEFNQNVFQQITALNNEKEIRLHCEIVKILNAFLNKTELHIISFFHSIRHVQNKQALVMLTPEVFHLVFPASGDLTLVACKRASLQNEEDKLVLSENFLNALVYGVLIEALGIEDTTLNLQRINFYLELEKREKQELRAFYGDLSSKNVFYSPFVSV